ncbi:P2 family phage major capsid protein, partial [Salmonella enterica]|uniref:P2 family phage major capsid protein n=2 Tax=Enterobacteriaceae TaxID=543 RepID=UPI00111A4DCE
AGTRRRSVIDNPKRDRVENYESVNEAYVVEDYDGACLVENIELLPEQADGNPGAALTAENIQTIVAAAVQGALDAQNAGGTGDGA